MRKILFSSFLLLLFSFCAIFSFAQIHGYTLTGVKGIRKNLADVIAYDNAHPQQYNPVRIIEEVEGPGLIGMDPKARAVTSFGTLVKPQNRRVPPVTTNTPTQSIYSNFLGIYYGDGGGATLDEPPDNCGDVGTTQVIVTANCYMKVFTKPTVTGTATTTATGTSTATPTSVVNFNLNTLFTNATLGISYISDPHVRFDRL